MRSERKKAAFSNWRCLFAVELPPSALSTAAHIEETVTNVTLGATVDPEGVNKNVFDVCFYSRTPEFLASEVFSIFAPLSETATSAEAQGRCRLEESGCKLLQGADQ